MVIFLDRVITARIKLSNFFGESQTSVVNNGKVLNIVIEDSGTGIDDNKMNKVFDPFYSEGKFKGKRNKGLGLAISQGIVQAHNGEINVSNSDDLGGAKFIVTLPILT
jgi:K+-sensing histidine kinase KdpD